MPNCSLVLLDKRDSQLEAVLKDSRCEFAEYKCHMFQLPLLFLLFLLACPTLQCESNCASCRDNDYYCLACSEGFELIESGICIQDRSISNCSLYDLTLNCVTCRPTFRLEWSLCRKSYDGCLYYQDGKCAHCLAGSFFSRDSASCSIKYLNCLEIDEKGICTGCFPKYELQNGKCVDKNADCASIDRDTGLCSSCAPTAFLLGYSCVPMDIANATRNCYFINTNRSNLTCLICKQGYAAYFGLCLTTEQILSKIPAASSLCANPEYLRSNQSICLDSAYDAITAKLAGCSIVDFGFRTCLLCEAKLTLQNGSCVTALNSFCLQFGTSGCDICKERFYLSEGVCQPFPPFCLTYRKGCEQCQTGFQLSNGNCIDPNCQTINAVSGLCQLCVLNYRLNAVGICKFSDPNCQLTTSSGDCSQCAKNYQLKPNGLCVYQDVNCLSFDNITGNCKLCSANYYYNSQGQLCIPLPLNCLSADISGRCAKCNPKFTLLSNYQCIYISTPAIPNCQMVDKDNTRRCLLCNQGFFSDGAGACQPLPLFCMQYDPNTNTCTQCNSNGVMKNGGCVDKNCQIFDLKGNCLACLQNYQFGNFGQCIPQIKDSNCKDEQFGICKSCSQRYYFNFQFLCVPVSPFCNTYDTNSGGCTSCYAGYTLTNTGECSISLESYRSIENPSEALLLACKTLNSNGDCTECYPNYDTIILSQRSNSSAPLVNCIQSIRLSANKYCIETNPTTSKCNRCVARMYADESGNCASVDENCDQYNSTDGSCLSCYPGFAVQWNAAKGKKQCLIHLDTDPNCQIRGNQSSCTKCYNGYYYSAQNFICMQLNQLCATANPSNGNCLSCYGGYTLVNGECLIAGQDVKPTVKTVISTSNLTNATGEATSSSSIEASSLVNLFEASVGCLQTDFGTGECRSCQGGYALINGSCIEKDLNCKTFDEKDPIKCLECYQGYKTYGANQAKCIIESTFVDNCAKYTLQMTCQLCDNGYILTPTNSHPPYTCKPLDPNCLVFNRLTNSCSQCTQGTVLEGRTCILPVYGIDPNCIFYANKLCQVCKQGWTLKDYTCSDS